MWTVKIFKSRQAFENWKTKVGHRHQWQEIFVNNAWGVEYRPLRYL